MKTKTLGAYSLLSLLSAGCVNEGYGPNSPDYFPQSSPPFTDRSDLRLNHKPAVTVVTTRTVQVCSLPEEALNESHR